MVNQIKEYVNSSPDGYGKLDAVVIAGDITNDGVPEQLSLAKSTFDSVIPEGTELIITVGNHDWYHYGAETLAQFEKVFPDCTFTGDTVIGGYHFITIVNDKNGWDISDEQLQMADSLISAAIAADSGKEKPVFLITHIGATDTVVGTSKEADILWDTALDKLDEIAKKYENLVVFSGHTHFPANDEGSVYQRDYTSVNTGSLFYAMRSFTPDGAIDMPDRHNMSQCYVIELDENSRMRIRV
jgi:3',5'-cyclic AMP phosphodiesterase CpdA